LSVCIPIFSLVDFVFSSAFTTSEKRRDSSQSPYLALQLGWIQESLPVSRPADFGSAEFTSKFSLMTNMRNPQFCCLLGHEAFNMCWCTWEIPYQKLLWTSLSGPLEACQSVFLYRARHWIPYLYNSVFFLLTLFILRFSGFPCWTCLILS
jgi:hypothetical protein